MRTILFAIGLFLLLPAAGKAQSADEKEIYRILSEQTESWNRGDLEDFMKGYWHSDSLVFIGKSGVTYGYANTLANYKKGYKNADEMGTLIFSQLKLQRLSSEYYYVIGKWDLKRKAGDVGGHYDLLFRKIKGKWCIIADHSS